MWMFPFHRNLTLAGTSVGDPTLTCRLDPELKALLGKALTRDPDNRYQSVEALQRTSSDTCRTGRWKPFGDNRLRH